MAMRGPVPVGGWARSGDVRCGQCRWARELEIKGRQFGTVLCIVNGPFINPQTGETRFPVTELGKTCGKAERAAQVAVESRQTATAAS